LAKKKYGKSFETDIETSCSDQNIFYFRVRDVNLPPDVRMRVKIPQNRYDCILYHKGYLFPIEQKSTKDKSISFSESMIKAHQIKNLTDATKFSGVIPGFLFNFRLLNENKCYFIHIDDFNTYKNIAENQFEHTYKSKINKSSIPIGICEEIGIEITNVKKKVNHRYYLNKMIDELIDRFGE
jgi:penicillin-binding protein-related factor A (putative recombinase)